MNASALSSLSASVALALASAIGRTGARGASWGLARFMRAPAANSGLFLLATLSALAASNALYSQPGPHPAPMFAPSRTVPTPVVAPEETASISRVPEPAALVAPEAGPATLETATIVRAVPSEPVGNADVFAVQKRLLDLGIFDGTVDGYYGPKTAGAIRAFEERNGMRPLGAMSPGVVEAILGSDGSGRVSQPVSSAPLAPAQVEAAPGATTLSTATVPVEPQAYVVAPVATAAIATPAPVPEAAEAVPSAAIQPPAEVPNVLIGRVEGGTETAAATTVIDQLMANFGGPRETAPLPAIAPPEAVAPVSAPAQPTPPAALVTASAPAQPMPPALTGSAGTTAAPAQPRTEEALVTRIQRGLASLGFLHGAIDGQANEATARAIRNFEVYHNYPVTGQVRPALVEMLASAGANV